MKVAIIGGGTSGIFASIMIKKLCPNIEVTIFERLEKVGKKILSTGNGRCNFTNSNLSPKRYNNSSFVSPIIKKLDYQKLLDELSTMGLFCMKDSEGRTYPYSEMANSFLDVLRINMRKLGVVEKCNYEVVKIFNKGSDAQPIFIIEDSRNQKTEADIVIMATGGKAYPILGSNGSGYKLLKPWKIEITNLFPGLVGVMVDKKSINGLAGLRVKAKVSLYDKKARQKVWEEKGEVQFKEDGISGIVIMQMASIIARSNVVKSNSVFNFELDLLPDYPEEQLFELLNERKKTMNKLENSDFLNGIFPKMLSFLLIKKSKLDLSAHVEDISSKDIIRLVNTIKNFDLEYKGVYDFNKAQVTIGGIDLNEMNKKTLEFVRIPQMYACGEILNVDGECGGYNMHFALASGYIVANSIYEKWYKNENNK